MKIHVNMSFSSRKTKNYAKHGKGKKKKNKMFLKTLKPVPGVEHHERALSTNSSVRERHHTGPPNSILEEASEIDYLET